MGKPFLQFDFKIENKNKRYKSFLTKLKKFILYHATVGIHQAQGKQKVVKRYNKISKSGKSVSHLAGKSHRMTIAKLAYQNEFGATIYIKPRYKVARRTVGKMSYVQGDKRVTVSTIEKYSRRMDARYQGYILFDKEGKFVMYKPPGSKIVIPKKEKSRSFIRKVVNKPSAELKDRVGNVLNGLLKIGGGRVSSSWNTIARIITEEMKNNVHDNKPNHEITKKAKGSSTPLKDEQDRIYNAIKYRIYKSGTKNANNYWNEKNARIIDKTLKTIDSLTDRGVIGSEQRITVKTLNTNK